MIGLSTLHYICFINCVVRPAIGNYGINEVEKPFLYLCLFMQWAFELKYSVSYLFQLLVWTPN